MEGQQGTSSLIPALGRDMSIECLVRCPRSSYQTLASLNRSFRSLFTTGQIYNFRRRIGIVEPLVCLSFNALEWEVFDPCCRRWMLLPRMPADECFMCSDKVSRAVGTELLVFGKDVNSMVIMRYSILTNSWSFVLGMNTPRFCAGAASLDEIAIFAGGCDTNGNILDTVELYDSDKGTWELLPSMIRPRKNSSAYFMGGKFYVFGGTSHPEKNEAPILTCGEEFDLETRTWRVIENMAPARRTPAEPPFFIVVLKNELYTVYYGGMELLKYDKSTNSWSTLGRLPERIYSMNGWGFSLKACGERLLVVGGANGVMGSMVELYACDPTESPLEWELLATRTSASFVYNCAVIDC